MGPVEAIRTLPRDFYRFRGTVTRSEYAWKTLLSSLLTAVAFTPIVAASLYLLRANEAGMSTFLGMMLTVVGAFGVVVLGFSLPLAIKRMRDIGLSFWWYCLPVLLYVAGISAGGQTGHVAATLANIAMTAGMFVLPSGLGKGRAKKKASVAA